MLALSSPLPFLRQSAAKSGKPIALHGGYPAFDKIESAVSAYLGLKTALYQAFYFSMFFHEA